MNWLTLLWSGAAGACLMLGLAHGLAWVRNRNAWASFWFSVTAAGVIGQMSCELVMMQAHSPATLETATRWAHVLYFCISAGMMGFVHSLFGTGRLWLLGLAVLANFTTGASLHFLSIESLREIDFLGETVMVPGGWQSNPWVRLGQGASLVMGAYVVDASLRLWRSGDCEARRRALLFGGTLTFFVVFNPLMATLVSRGQWNLPVLPSIPFFLMAMFMAYELSRDFLNSARLASDLRLSEQRLKLAAEASSMALWEWNVITKHNWTSEYWPKLYGRPFDGKFDLQQFVERMHPDDRAVVIRNVEQALAGPGDYKAEYRVLQPDGSTRWISAIGKVKRDAHGIPLMMRGASLDITERKPAELRLATQHKELARLTRLKVLGEMAGIIAHELKQPLSAILNNAHVARCSFAFPHPDPAEMLAILDDIAADARRGGDIIQSMRTMLQRGEPTEISEISIEEKIGKTLSMLHGEFAARNVIVETDIPASLPPVHMNRVEFQQVLVNLLVNGMDAMEEESRCRVLKVAATRGDDCVTISVIDRGPGISPETVPRLFEPFFSTKHDGLGLGLSISLSLLQKCGGTLVAENHPAGGAVFRMVIPTQNHVDYARGHAPEGLG